MKWRLIIKYVGCNKNIADFGIVWSNGNAEHIARVVYPDDSMIGNNVSCSEAIGAIISKRYRQSV